MRTGPKYRECPAEIGTVGSYGTFQEPQNFTFLYCLKDYHLVPTSLPPQKIKVTNCEVVEGRQCCRKWMIFFCNQCRKQDEEE